MGINLSPRLSVNPSKGPKKAVKWSNQNVLCGKYYKPVTKKLQKLQNGYKID